MFSYRSLPAVYRYQSFRPKTIEEAEQFIIKNTKHFDKEGCWHQLAMELKERVIGDVELHFIGPMNLHCEIGYTLSPEYQHKGYAREAVEYVLRKSVEKDKEWAEIVYSHIGG